MKKPGNQEATEKLREIAFWLESHNIKPLVERPVAATEFPEVSSARWWGWCGGRGAHACMWREGRTCARG